MRPDRWRVLPLVVASAAALFGLAGCTLPTGSDGGGYGPAPASGGAAAEPVSATPSQLKMSGSAWTPARFAVRRQTPISLRIVNTDETWHNFTLQPARISQNVPAGGQATVKFPALLPGDHVFWCKYHRQEMRGWVVVR